MAKSAADPSKKYLSHTLAEWACWLRYEHLSAEAIRAAKLFWYDSVGCALGGSQQEDAHILLAHHREMAGHPSGNPSGTGVPPVSGPSTCFVSGFRTNPVDAAFLNCHMIRAMDYNDIYWKADPCHPSDILGGPLALCEMLTAAGKPGGSGKDLILATIIAYEVEQRLCEFGLPGIREYGWHHATLTAFAAPLAAGRILNLTVDQMVQAIGISASRTFTPGAVTAGKLTNMKNTVDPWATRMGVESALLARRGYSGPEHMIDGKEGLYAVFGKVHVGQASRLPAAGTAAPQFQPAKFDTAKLIDALPKGPGDHYRILDCGMKSYPIEALSHAPLTAMMKCIQENGIRPEQVAEIKVEVIARAADILGDPHKYRPDSKETADHSLPYCMAVGLVDGMVTPLQFKEERVLDKSLIPVMDKVKVVANDEFEALFPRFQPSRVTITTTGGGGGQSFSKRVDVPKGDPRDPMTEDEIGVKFRALGESVIGKDRCRQAAEIILSLENERDMSRLMQATTAP
ncbi:MAG: MmgE/PrpD family protein [Phycisphaerales bacterium]